VRSRLPALLLLLLVALPSCSAFQTPRVQRGNKVDVTQLKDLVIGTSTKADVSSLFGSPTARATFDDNKWIYISEMTRTRIGRTPGVIDQQVTMFAFDQGGVLREIKQLDQDASRDVDVVSRATPSPGSEASFMQQLLGNVGKFTPGGPSGSGAGSGGSGGSIGPGSSGGQLGL
jgi:outer membrane protein assembly factor BamE (lipoprotein component of BamABCDE complex)